MSDISDAPHVVGQLMADWSGDAMRYTGTLGDPGHMPHGIGRAEYVDTGAFCMQNPARHWGRPQLCRALGRGLLQRGGRVHVVGRQHARRPVAQRPSPRRRLPSLRQQRHVRRDLVQGPARGWVCDGWTAAERATGKAVQFVAASGESFQGEFQHDARVRGVLTTQDGAQALHDYTPRRARIDPSPRA